MRYRVWDEEDRKEHTISTCITDLGEVGDTQKVIIKKGGKKEVHHFKVLEILPELN